MADERIVRIEAPARLHFGMLDLRGSLGRRFGGIGAGVFDPSLVIEVERAEAVEAEGAEAQRAAEFATRYLASQGIGEGVRIVIRRAIPGHSGLGSGTQLALAVARGIAELYDLPTDTGALAATVGRARRSAIGTWLFDGGGFVVEGGRRDDSELIAPLLARLSIPETWRCVVALPRNAQKGVSGDPEAQAFRELPAPPLREVEHVAHLLVMSLLPALVDGDIAAFGSAITEIQQINGGWFAPAQGGPFASGASTELINKMGAWGAAGVGQSSWGPAVYGIVDGDAAAAELAANARALLNGAGTVYVNEFAGTGARVTILDPTAARAPQ
ncbi:MAG TPA: beta-ribofuranosylaminobenzene 5'-phosphate synthase family protein [Gemmatimonadaceae bacterium]|nr:beta-ribofuranosylaminobenzene 5'-phosphate synthase family protein [Gemmatimonadaceae bacterium]